MIKMEHSSFEEGKEFQVFLDDIVKSCEKTQEEVLKAAGESLKKAIVAELRILKRKGALPAKRGIHMADDVKVSQRKDKYGESYVRIGGGKKTGTLWHLVNDGTLYSMPTHFMEKALNSNEKAIEGKLDSALGKEF